MSLDEDLEPLLGGLVEGEHEQVQVDRQTVQDRHLRLLAGADLVRGQGCQNGLSKRLR